MTDFRHWLRDLNGRRVTADDIAHKLGVSRTTVTRRLVNDELTADELITLANAYKVNPLQALVDLGRITDHDHVRVCAGGCVPAGQGRATAAAKAI